MSAIGKWFVMMYTQIGDYVTPMVDDEGEPVLFESEGAANDCAKDYPYAREFGFDVYEVGGRIMSVFKVSESPVMCPTDRELALQAENAALRAKLEQALEYAIDFEGRAYRAEAKLEEIDAAHKKIEGDLCDDLNDVLIKLAELKADAARYRWLANYLPSMDESHDDAIVSCKDAKDITAVIDAAMKGEQP